MAQKKIQPAQLDPSIVTQSAMTSYVDTVPMVAVQSTAPTRTNELWLDTSDNSATSYGNAQTLNGYAASATPTANKILPLDGSAKFPSTVLQLPSVNKQDDTTNSVLNGARMEIGWGVMPVSTSGGVYDEVVTFSTPFTSKPIVMLTFSGDLSTVVANGGGNTIEGIVGSKIHSITTTNFHAYFYKPNGANWGANGYGYYNWIAVGV